MDIFDNRLASLALSLFLPSFSLSFTHTLSLFISAPLSHLPLLNTCYLRIYDQPSNLHTNWDPVPAQMNFSIFSCFTFKNFTVVLKWPKREKFVAGIFTQIRPVWIGELEIRPKTSMVGALYFYFYRQNLFLAMSATAIEIFFVYLRRKNVVLHCFYINFDRSWKILLKF